MYIFIQNVPKSPTSLSILCRPENCLFFKDGIPIRLYGTARFGRCRASKSPFHMPSINRTCSAHRAVSDVTRVPYTKTLHMTPQKIVESCQNRCPCLPWNWSPSTNPWIWIRNVEVIPHISIKFRWWLKGCIAAVLGHQNELEQIVTPVRSQNSKLYSTQTVRFRTGVPLWTMISLLSWTTY